MYSTEKRCQYANNQLADVICQLRFPEILTINTKTPAEFQEIIRNVYPLYSTSLETTPPQIMGTPGNLQLHTPPATVNHQFTSQDGIWRVNLTSKFISLACNHYTNWESFAKRLDMPLAAFIRIYTPAYFERIGLRYLNFISREKLNLNDVLFRDLISPKYLGLLADHEISEQDTVRCGVDAELTIRDNCKVKIHAGPGLVKQNGIQESELKYIFDQDLFVASNIPVTSSATTIETLHAQAYPIFRDAITTTLHEALDPIDS